MTVALRAGTEIANENRSHLPRENVFYFLLKKGVLFLQKKTCFENAKCECVSFAFNNHSQLDAIGLLGRAIPQEAAPIRTVIAENCLKFQ